MAAPTVALVNNAQREHQEFMATVEAAARENGAVIEALASDGTAVFPADDTYAPLWRELAGARRVLSFALQGDAEVRGEAAWHGTHWAMALHTPQGTAHLALRLAGAAQPEERARRRGLRAGHGRVAGRGGRAGSKPSRR